MSRWLVIAAVALGCGSRLELDGGDMGGDAGAKQSSCTPTRPATLDPSLVARGMQLVKANKCQQCHGTDLAGNDNGVYIVGRSTPAYPPNLTPDLDSGIGCWSDTQIENAILNGVDDQGQPICPPMPHFARKGLTPADAQALAAFLRSLPAQVNQVPETPMCEPWGELGGGCIDDGDCPIGAACLLDFCVTVLEGGGPDGGN